MSEIPINDHMGVRGRETYLVLSIWLRCRSSLFLSTFIAKSWNDRNSTCRERVYQ
jgi:hypothetical protein